MNFNWEDKDHAKGMAECMWVLTMCARMCMYVWEGAYVLMCMHVCTYVCMITGVFMGVNSHKVRILNNSSNGKSEESSYTMYFISLSPRVVLSNWGPAVEFYYFNFEICVTFFMLYLFNNVKVSCCFTMPA